MFAINQPQQDKCVSHFNSEMLNVISHQNAIKIHTEIGGVVKMNITFISDGCIQTDGHYQQRN